MTVGVTVAVVPLTDPSRVPSLLLSVKLVGLPVIVQLSCAEPPAAIVEGVAVKLVMTGAPLPPPEIPGQAVSKSANTPRVRGQKRRSAGFSCRISISLKNSHPCKKVFIRTEGQNVSILSI